MNTKVELPPVSTQHKNKNDDATDPEDQSASQPIILHFLQEASKLAAPSHRSLVDSTFDPVTSKTEDAPASDDFSDTCSQQGWAQTFSYHGEENSDMHMITTHIGPDLRGSNPWEVMSLINLQCERLLHHRGQGDSDCTSTSFSSLESNSLANPSESSSQAVVQRDNLLYPASRGGEGTRVAPATGTPGKLGEGFGENCPVRRRAASATRSGLAESQPPDGGSRYQSAHSAAMEVKLSVVTGSQWGVSGPEDRSASAEPAARRGASSDEAWLQTRLSPADDGNAVGGAAGRPARTSDRVVCLARGCFSAGDLLPTDPAVPLDFNSNLLLTFDPLDDDAHTFPSTPKQPAWAVLSHEQLTQNKSQPMGKTTEPECVEDHPDHNARRPAVTQQPCFPWTRDAESTAAQCAASYKSGAEDSRTPTGSPPCPSTAAAAARGANPRRKQPHPTRSADATDPDFQGVMFRMQGQLDNSRGQCRLLVDSKYRRKPRLRTRSSQSSLRTSSSDEDPDPSTGGSRSKECASCCTKKTPMWRDAEDGTPLCNACGIRYKKYRVRCVNCWHIPRKEGNAHSRCPKCGSAARPAATPRKHSAC